MKYFFLAIIAFLVSCVPSDRIVSEIPSYAGVYGKITLEGVDSIDTFTQLTISMREKAANHGFIFRAFNSGSTSINALWIKIAGQQAQTYFRADDIRENDKNKRTMLTLLTDPNPPPLTQSFNQSLIVLLEDLADRLKISTTKIKVELR